MLWQLNNGVCFNSTSKSCTLMLHMLSDMTNGSSEMHREDLTPPTHYFGIVHIYIISTSSRLGSLSESPKAFGKQICELSVTIYMRTSSYMFFSYFYFTIGKFNWVFRKITIGNQMVFKICKPNCLFLPTGCCNLGIKKTLSFYLGIFS